MKVNPKKGNCGGNCGNNSGGNCGSGCSGSGQHNCGSGGSCDKKQKKKSPIVHKHTPALCPVACIHGSHTNTSVQKMILILLAPEDRKKIANGDVAFVFIYKSAKESFTVLMVMNMYCREKFLRAWCLEDKRFHIDCARNVAFDDVDIMKKEIQEKTNKMKSGRFDYP
ncbi:MAG: hypothetical protein WC430_01755 [Patescibacteria group bacterium]|jgi:hypothetical protein